MNSFCEIIDGIHDYLSSRDDLNNVRFIVSSPGKKAPNFLNEIYVTIGINQIEISQGAFSGYLGVMSEKEIYGDLNDINVGMKIYIPQNTDGAKCYDVFSKIYRSLLEDGEKFNFQSIRCEKIKYDSDVFAFTMECELKISMLVGHENAIS